jgi:uncharacterized protein (TIGR03067 family)
MTMSTAVLLAGTALLGAAPGRADAPRGDLTRLQGCWTAQAGPQRNYQVRLEIQGATARVKIVTPQGVTVRAQGEVRVDESASPHALDWVHFQGVNDQRLPDIAAIYELAGDTFRVCNGGPDNERPTEFKPGDGLLAAVVTFQRARESARGAESTAAPSGPAAERPGH